MKVAIITFLGTNCDRDMEYAFKLLGAKTQFIWHTSREKIDADLVVLPGGFSYGDYLRSAAIAKLTPVIEPLLEYAKKGGYILGICNGFQLLLELRLLKGAMIKNKELDFISKFLNLKVINNDNKLLKNFNKDEIIQLPIAHADGNYFIDDDGLKKLYDKELILLKYCDEHGNETAPNGSRDAIAGICDEKKKIFGLMPHPERAVEEILGYVDGIRMLKGLI